MFIRGHVDEERTILVVDDEADVVAALESTLVDQGYGIRQATRWTEAIAEIQDKRPDAVLLDLYLPTVQGEALLEFIRDFDEKLPVIIISSGIDPTKLDHLGKMGANGFIRKPFTEEDLFVVVQQILSELEAQEAVSRSVLSQADPGRTAPPPSDPTKVVPGAGIERLEQRRPEVESAPARRTVRHSSRRRRSMRNYIIAFFMCLVATWMLVVARDMFSQGLFGIDIQDTREEVE